MTTAQNSTPHKRAFLAGTTAATAVAVGVAGKGVAVPLPVFVDNSALFPNLEGKFASESAAVSRR